MSAGGVAGFAIEAFQKGIISAEDTRGVELKFGDTAAVEYILESIASRSGIGDLLANGVRIAARELGEEAEAFAVHVKGLESPAWGPRSVPGMALALATADRGGCHQRAFPILYELGGEWEGKVVERNAIAGKGKIVAHLQNYLAALDTLVKCDFAQYGISAQTYCRMLETALGRPFNTTMLMELGERIWNQGRLFNLREGFTRADDNLPRRFTEEPLPGGPHQGERVTKDQLKQMLDEYYLARGWDLKGCPTEETLNRLGLHDLTALVKVPNSNH